MTATIYLGKGDHFYHYCVLDDNNPSDIFDYCNYENEAFTYSLSLYAPPLNNNVNIYFKPLECSLASELGYEDNENFYAMCLDLDTDGKPTIYLNQNYANFAIYGSTSFENIKFSGINQLAVPIISSINLKQLPALYCIVENEPSASD